MWLNELSLLSPIRDTQTRRGWSWGRPEENGKSGKVRLEWEFVNAETSSHLVLPFVMRLNSSTVGIDAILWEYVEEHMEHSGVSWYFASIPFACCVSSLCSIYLPKLQTVSLGLSVCVSVCLCVCLCVSLCVTLCISLCVSVCLCVCHCVSLCASLYVWHCVSLYVSLCVSPHCRLLCLLLPSPCTGQHLSPPIQTLSCCVSQLSNAHPPILDPFTSLLSLNLDSKSILAQINVLSMSLFCGN